MKCSVEGCPGEYDKRKIIHTVRYRGEIIVVDNVPAEVCSVCGDVLLEPETVRRIEILLQGVNAPVRTAPVYEYMAVSF
jgi:YgiT-type zinc finger domain-containing protein